jgi:hypothetical protein
MCQQMRRLCLTGCTPLSVKVAQDGWIDYFSLGSENTKTVRSSCFEDPATMQQSPVMILSKDEPHPFVFASPSFEKLLLACLSAVALPQTPT